MAVLVSERLLARSALLLNKFLFPGPLRKEHVIQVERKLDNNPNWLEADLLAIPTIPLFT